MRHVACQPRLMNLGFVLIDVFIDVNNINPISNQADRHRKTPRNPSHFPEHMETHQ
jgi:hypothetical protein